MATVDGNALDGSTLVAIREHLTSLNALMGSIGVDRFAYSVEEAAPLLGLKPYTTRELCRNGQVHAFKVNTDKCGPYSAWRITGAEIKRYKEEGKLPVDMDRNRNRTAESERRRLGLPSQ